MSLGCLQCRSSLSVIHAGHASEAVRLEVEAHLGECEACRQEQARWAVIGELRSAPVQHLSSEARDRVRRAMMAASESRIEAQTEAQTGARMAARPWRLVLAGAAACGLAVAVGAGLGHDAGARLDAKVLSGRIVLRGVSAAPGTAIRDGEELATEAGPGGTPGAASSDPLAMSDRSAGPAGIVRLDGPVVELAPDTRLAWRRETHTIDLTRGQVTVEVEPGRGTRFRVATRRFVAEVVGTRFVVTESSVATERGKVRIIDNEGRELAMVGPGQSWRWPAEPPPSAVGPVIPVALAAPLATPAPISGALAAVAVRATQLLPASAPATQATPVEGRASPSLRAPRSAGGIAAPAGPEPLRALLDQASSAVARGRNGEARALLSELLMRRPSAHIDAEAGMLLADAARNEGDQDEALRRYREVVRRHAALAQAEIALFFIGQLEAELGRGDAARRTLGEYLARYPHGTFLAEARTRLSHLDAP